MLAMRTTRELVPPVSRPNGHWVLVRGSIHEGYEYVRGVKSPLLHQRPSPFGEVELLKDSAQRFDGISA
jgi:hypothetical protein